MVQKSNKINLANTKDLSCGAYLRYIRQQKGISLETVSGKTKIVSRIIESIENDDYQNLPPKPFLKGMIANYARFLKIDEQQILTLYETSNGRSIGAGKNDFLPRNRFIVKAPAILRIIKFLVMFLIKISIFAIIIGYLIYEILFFVLPPKIILLSPQQDISLNQPQIIIKGKVIRGKILYWGNTPIALNSQGGFRINITLTPGLNKIRLRALNNVGKESFVTRNIVYNQPQTQK